MRTRRSSAMLAAALMLVSGTAASGETTTLWRISGEENTVYLLGSVHVLTRADYPLPSALLAAYEDAEALVMEIDLDDLDPVAASATVLSNAVAGPDASLRSLLGDSDYERARSRARDAGFRLEDFDAVEPWYAAMAMTQTAMARQGYDANLGVDMFLSSLAERDEKPLAGLETLEQQIQFFDSMPLALQSNLFQQTLTDIAALSSDMSDLVQAWKIGDIAYLEAELLATLREYPDLHRVLVVERNRAWIERIEALLSEPIDYLVVVGALHLVGPDSINALLKHRGYNLEQWAGGD